MARLAERAVLGAAIAVLHTLCRNALREEVFVYQTRTLLGQTDVARLASSLRIAESVDLEYRLLRVLDVLGNEVETLLCGVGQSKAHPNPLCRIVFSMNQ